MYVTTKKQKVWVKIWKRAKRATSRCLQHSPEKTKHRCSTENRRRNGGSQVAKGSEEQVGREPCVLSVRPSARAKASQTAQAHVRPNTIQEVRWQNQMTDRLLTTKYNRPPTSKMPLEQVA